MRAPSLVRTLRRHHRAVLCVVLGGSGHDHDFESSILCIGAQTRGQMPEVCILWCLSSSRRCRLNTLSTNGTSQVSEICHQSEPSVMVFKASKASNPSRLPMKKWVLRFSFRHHADGQPRPWFRDWAFDCKASWEPQPFLKGSKLFPRPWRPERAVEQGRWVAQAVGTPIEPTCCARARVLWAKALLQ